MARGENKDHKQHQQGVCELPTLVGWEVGRKAPGLFHGSHHVSRVGQGQGGPARRVILEHLLTRRNPTRDTSNTSQADPTRQAILLENLLTRPAGRVLIREKPCKKYYIINSIEAVECHHPRPTQLTKKNKSAKKFGYYNSTRVDEGRKC